jgi:hypothetical protein
MTPKRNLSSHKIDVVVALAQAALAAVHKGDLGRMRQGTANIDGYVHWNEPRTHSRRRWITVDELGREVRR